MKRTSLVLVAFVAFIALTFNAGTVSAAVVQPLNLNSNMDLGDVRSNMSTSDDGGGRYSLLLGFDTSCGVPTSASVSVSRNSSNPLWATVDLFVYGLLDIEPTIKDWRYQSSSIHRRNGLDFSSWNGAGGSQQDIWQSGGEKGGPDSYTSTIFSSNSLGVSLSGVGDITYANASYNEYDASSYKWIDGDGIVHVETIPARFMMEAMWNVEFVGSTYANAAISLPVNFISSPVPEPTSLGLIGCAGLLMGRRSRRV